MTITLPYAAELDLNRFRAYKINHAASQLSTAKEATVDASTIAIFEKGLTFWQDLPLEDLLCFAVMEACRRFENE